jgi:hypothetical protein
MKCLVSRLGSWVGAYTRANHGKGFHYILANETKYSDHDNRDQHQNECILHQSLASTLQPRYFAFQDAASFDTSGSTLR